MNDLHGISEFDLLKGSKREFYILGIIFDEQDIAKFRRRVINGVVRCPGDFFDRSKYGAQRSAQGERQTLNAGERWITLAGFDVTDVGAMQVGSFREFLLRNAKLNS